MDLEIASVNEEEKKTMSVKKTQKDSIEEKEEKWQTRIKSFKCGISYIYETKELSDVEFTIGNKIFKAHRLILGARNPVFAKILLKSNAPNKILYEEVSEIGFDILLKFIYTEELGTTNCEDIVEAHQTALRFKQEKLLEECESLMEKWELTCNNVCTILNLAVEILFLKEKCLKYITNNGEDVINSEDFLNATTESIKEMFQNNCFEKVPIMIILRNVLRWGAKQFPLLEDYTMVREHLMLTGILGRLKIHMLSMEELSQFIAEYQNLLSPLEFQQFTLYNLSVSDEKILPEWCIV